VIALVGWFYVSKIPLNYPGAHSLQTDGPYQTREHCEIARQDAEDMAKMFGLQIETKPCFEKKTA
jgi:hypothetical protein